METGVHDGGLAGDGGNESRSHMLGSRSSRNELHPQVAGRDALGRADVDVIMESQQNSTNTLARSTQPRSVAASMRSVLAVNCPRLTGVVYIIAA